MKILSNKEGKPYAVELNGRRYKIKEMEFDGAVLRRVTTTLHSQWLEVSEQMLVTESANDPTVIEDITANPHLGSGYGLVKKVRINGRNKEVDSAEYDRRGHLKWVTLKTKPNEIIPIPDELGAKFRMPANLAPRRGKISAIRDDIFWNRRETMPPIHPSLQPLAPPEPTVSEPTRSRVPHRTFNIPIDDSPPRVPEIDDEDDEFDEDDLPF